MPLQGNPDDIGFASLQGISSRCPSDGYSSGEGLGDGTLEEGDSVVCGDPLGHPQGHSQLALFCLWLFSSSSPMVLAYQAL